MSEKLSINGNRKLRGKVYLSGAKNSALKVLLAALLTNDPVVIHNIPVKLIDISETLRLLRSLDVPVKVDQTTVKIFPDSLKNSTITLAGDFKIRTTLLMLGILLSKFGYARIPLPGGCQIGDRGVDLHAFALKQLGAKVKITKHYIEASAKQLRGSEIIFPIRTTGGTENAILAAVFAQGITVIKNAHTRPEVLDLVAFLNSMGARIKISGSGLIEVIGVKSLHGTTHTIINDNVEALTFIIAAAVTGSNISIMNCPHEHLEIPLIYLREAGLKYNLRGREMQIKGDGPLTPVDLSTGSYPGINSDYQPLFTVFATQANGISHITDIRFRDRFKYTEELRKMGAKIKKTDNQLKIFGATRLKGCQVKAWDLRGGAALVVAGLSANGKTIITNATQIDRGYETIGKKLVSLGASVEFSNEQ